MNIGMLWFDNDPKANLDSKIERAAHYYARKYGRNPTLCFVHPSMLAASAAKNAEMKPPSENKNLVAGGIEVRSNRSVLPNHFWIGVNTAAEAMAA